MKTIKSKFTADEDYKILLFRTEKRVHGGQNREDVMLNIDTFIKNIEDITGLKMQNVCKLSYNGCFVGMSHAKFPYIGNATPEPVKLTDYHYIKLQISRWLDVNNKTNVAQLFRKINSIPTKKILIKDYKLIMNDNVTLIRKSSKTHLVFSKDETHYFFTINAKKYLNELNSLLAAQL